MNSSPPKLTPGEVIAQWRQQPEKQDFIRQLYYDEDVWAASWRFYHSPEFQEVLKIARRADKAQGRVLDIGGGNGVAALAWHHAGYDVAIIEPDASDIVGVGALYPVIEARQLPIIVHQGYAEDAPFPDAAFDIVYCRQVLHHITDLSALMREVRRLLKADGLFIATREHVISKPEDLAAFLNQHPLHPYTGGEHAYLEREYLAALQPYFSRVRVLQFYDSVINYFPLSEQELRRLIWKEWCRYGVFYRLRLCSLLAAMPFLRQWAIRRMNARNRLPGRLYSFIARP